MNYKLIGAVCVIVGCGSCGFLMASRYLSNMRQLQSLITVLDFMDSELQYRATPLPQLCRQAAEQVRGKVGQIFLLLAEELEAQVSPDVRRCMACALDRTGGVWCPVVCILSELSGSLGRFDLCGQLRAIDHARTLCREKLNQLQQGKDNRLRSYQTLGICAGAAIAILLV